MVARVIENINSFKMNNTDIIEVSKKVLERLSKMDNERLLGNSLERLIFPNKFPTKILTETKLKKQFRISEQELRFLFVEEFLTKESLKHKFFYSIETPTEAKYKFGKKFEDISVSDAGRSASVDMSIFDKNDNYERILNIEFKHQNSSQFSIGKDILKLMHEKQNGAFVFLLDNTNKGSFKNTTGNKMGVLDKLNKSFTKFRDEDCWKGEKSILLVIMSLKEKVLIHRNITYDQIDKNEDIFNFTNNVYGNISSFRDESGWMIESKILTVEDISIRNKL